MFEEDYERCFICQVPCKGLYCSSECRIRDKGTPSPAIKPAPAAIKLTSQIPVSLSPLLRPLHHHVAPSPRVTPSNADSSSSSSITSSPIQSPRTIPSGGDSPQNQAFDLPPLAYPKDSTFHPSFALPGSMPVKIPNLAARTPQSHTPGAHTPASGNTVYPVGASIDTLRFGRRPGLTNSVISPNALMPRCACGKPANHRGRAVSKDRGLEVGLSNLILGPSANHDQPQRTSRIVSDSAASPGQPQLIHNYRQAATGYNTPEITDARGASYLSRSRSDPIPPSLDGRRNVIAPSPNRIASRRPSNVISERHATHSPVLRPIVDMPSTIAPESLAGSPRRGRSRERQHHPLEREFSASGFNLPPDREHPPSRSRHRRDERRRSNESRERQRTPATALPPLPEPPQIMPSWNRHSSPDVGPGEGVAPSRRNGSGSPRSPVQDEARQEALRRASNQLGAVFGVAAG